LRHHTLFATSLIAGILLVLLPVLVVAGPSPTQATVHPRVWETLQADGEAQVLVVLRAQADLRAADALPTRQARGRYVYDTLWAVAQATQRGLRSALDAQGVDYQAFYIVNAIKLRAADALVRSLAARSDVDRIVPDPWIRGLPATSPAVGTDLSLPAGLAAPQGVEGNVTRIQADDVWALGYTGQGIVVAGQDTGYDWDHPALKSQYRGWNGTSVDHDYNWHDAIHENDPHTPAGNPCGFSSAEPCDDGGHGTHTMGTMVGDDALGNQIGVAPGARWIGCRNMEQNWGTPATYIECFEFFLAPYPVLGGPAQGDPALAPHVVNNSWKCPAIEGCDLDTLEAAVQALRQAGIVVVASAGNLGDSCSTVVHSPGIYRQSFSVGAFSHYTDQIASFSSRGPVTYGGDTYRKPDIAAPGVSIRSSVPGGAYTYLSGTSMAAPHVAGAVALLLSAAPGYSGKVDAIEHILTTTTEPVTTTAACGGDGPADVPNNVWGWGILDTLHAVNTATASSLQGTVVGATTGSPIGAARVIADPGAGWAGPDILTAPTGHYTLTLAAGTYDVTARAMGYLPQTVTNVVVISGQVTTLDFALLPNRLFLPLVLKGP
jgi:serine protease AprX